MKAFTLALCSLCFSLGLVAKSGKIVLSGQVQNQSMESIQISHLDYKKLVSSELDADGNFKMTAKIEEGYYLLEYGRNSAYIYLYPKDEIQIRFDANQFNTTLAFEGLGSARNNYLAKKRNSNAKLTKNLEAFYAKEEDRYLQNINTVKETNLNLLADYELENFFIKAETKSLEYERLFCIHRYKNNYKFYLGGEINPSEDFYKPLENLNLNDEDDYAQQPYFRYLVDSIWNERIQNAPDVDGMLNELRKVSSTKVLNSLVNDFYSRIATKYERPKDYLDLIKRVTTHQPFIDAAEERYQKLIASKSLTKGDFSPEFSYESVDGGIIQLSDFKGKIVYIDVWATWCAPCIKQVPYLKELEKIYHDENIVFVSISVDRKESKKTWKQMIEEKQLGGIQLFADQSFNSEFMKAYSVNSIPRFILIDDEGKIINPEAPRPSYEKTKMLINELLN